jgi:GDPmannose 4,6-dehydratase
MTFVTRKITRALARISLGLQDCLYLGNLDAKRDWGHAKDYVKMQWLMLQQEQPEDYVIATGKQHSVRDFVNIAARTLGMEIEWKDKGINEKAIFTGTQHAAPDTLHPSAGQIIVAVDPKYFRPTEVETLLGNPAKAKEKLGWTPQITFKDMVTEMVRKDLEEARRDNLCKTHGFSTYHYNE